MKRKFEIAVYAKPLMHVTVEVEAENDAAARVAAYEKVTDDLGAYAMNWSEYELDRDDILPAEECEIVEELCSCASPNPTKDFRCATCDRVLGEGV